MRTTRKWLVVSLVALVSASGIAFAMPEAQADTGCASGWACVWQNSSFQGSWAASNYDSFLRTASDKAGRAKTQSNSAWANGSLCISTEFRTGSTASDRYFVLNSQQRTGVNYRDPHLSNGAGTGRWAKENWQNRVRYIRFDGGPNCR